MFIDHFVLHWVFSSFQFYSLFQTRQEMRFLYRDILHGPIINYHLMFISLDIQYLPSPSDTSRLGTSWWTPRGSSASRRRAPGSPGAPVWTSQMSSAPSPAQGRHRRSLDTTIIMTYNWIRCLEFHPLKLLRQHPHLAGVAGQLGVTVHAHIHEHHIASRGADTAGLPGEVEPGTWNKIMGDSIDS